MVDAPETIQQLTLDDYIQLYEQEGPFEIINGERKAIMPPITLHVLMVRALFRLLDAHCTGNQLGEVLTETPFVLTYDSDWVSGSRVPDLMFISAKRWQHYISTTEEWRGKPIILVPDLVIEVVSPNDTYSELQEKVDLYLADGVKLVWVVDPKRNRVAVYDGDHYTMLDKSGKLSGMQIIPELTIDLQSLFDI